MLWGQEGRSEWVAIEVKRVITQDEGKGTKTEG